MPSNSVLLLGVFRLLVHRSQFGESSSSARSSRASSEMASRVPVDGSNITDWPLSVGFSQEFFFRFEDLTIAMIRHFGFFQSGYLSQKSRRAILTCRDISIVSLVPPMSISTKSAS